MKNAKGVHNKKEAVPHRVAELSSVRNTLSCATPTVCVKKMLPVPFRSVFNERNRMVS